MKVSAILNTALALKLETVLYTALTKILVICTFFLLPSHSGQLYLLLANLRQQAQINHIHIPW